MAKQRRKIADMAISMTSKVSTTSFKVFVMVMTGIICFPLPRYIILTIHHIHHHDFWYIFFNISISLKLYVSSTCSDTFTQNLSMKSNSFSQTISINLRMISLFSSLNLYCSLSFSRIFASFRYFSKLIRQEEQRLLTFRLWHASLTASSPPFSASDNLWRNYIMFLAQM